MAMYVYLSLSGMEIVDLLESLQLHNTTFAGLQQKPGPHSHHPAALFSGWHLFPYRVARHPGVPGTLVPMHLPWYPGTQVLGYQGNQVSLGQWFVM